jgi:type IV pilus assembly protein PilQ
MLCLFMLAGGSVAHTAEIARNEQGEPLVTNIFAESDLRQALADIAAQTGVSLIPDMTVQGSVSADLQRVPLEQALTIVLSSAGLAYRKMDGGYYLIGAADPSNPNFSLLCTTEVIQLNYIKPSEVMSMLGSLYGNFLSAAGYSAGKETKSAPASQSAEKQSPVRESYQLIITAPRTLLPRIKADIAQIDRAPRQVMLEAAVVEIARDDLKNLGIDWNSEHFRQDLTSGGPNLVYSTIANTEMVALTALFTKGVAHLRANPRVAAADGYTAELEAGKENYFVITSGPTNNPYSSLQQIKSGIILRITPRVLAEGNEIALQVAPEVRDVTGKGANGLPEITVRRANTTLRVPNGQSIIIGGLTNSFTRDTVSRVPVLSSIPLLGGLFKRTVRSETQSEVVIVITPRLLAETAPMGGVESPVLQQDLAPYLAPKE